MSEQPLTDPPFHPRGYIDETPDVDALLGIYQATLDFQCLQGSEAHGRVTVEGSALVVEQVITAAADAFRADAER